MKSALTGLRFSIILTTFFVLPLSCWLLLFFIFIFLLVVLIVLLVLIIIFLIFLLLIVYRDGNVGHIVPRLWACLTCWHRKLLSLVVCFLKCKLLVHKEVGELVEILLLRPGGYD